MSEPISVPPGYRFLRNINDGGFGSVVEVEENSTGEHFAVKMIRCMSSKDKERIEREVNRLRTFVHPHIVRLKEVIAMENAQAIVMELGGQSLAQVVKSHSERGVLIDRHIVYQVMVDISSALCFMHNDAGERTAHGDVKLENILLFGDGHAKLCDLGAAESEDGSSTRGVMSMQYVSPERIEDDQGRASGSADVWALGIVLHFLLFGKSPFRSAHSAGLIREIGSFKASKIEKSCGDDERELLKRLLDPDYESRLTSKQLVESSILRCLINTTGTGWKLSEMKSRETEKRVVDLEASLRASEAKVEELTKDNQTLQYRLMDEQAGHKIKQTQLKEERTARQREMERSAGLQIALKKEQTTRQKEKDEFEKERNHLRRKVEEFELLMRRVQPMVGLRSERTQARVVRSRKGAAAMEVNPAVGYLLSGSIFTRTAGGRYPTLQSFTSGKVVARFTFLISRITGWNRIGIVASSQTQEVKKEIYWFTTLLGGAGWDLFEDARFAIQNEKDYSSGSACAAGKEGQRVVLEADGRDGKRTLRLSQNGQTQPTFFSHIPLPFRFAVLLGGTDDSVWIDSVEELTEPTLSGGTTEIRMDE
ncbi:putative CBL-interacting protein kinase 23 [Blattamonas nauphoetae]|uniref:non-specific serine/threonine protein kinase n=1 Tax=Blattamonas nauphoetae TaxID=2049346 RepID=A0ABQ9Y7G2_9EUKA|nr:putative CBL-interacting protein kinase 23 [Blattamonas nauphoetae]